MRWTYIEDVDPDVLAGRIRCFQCGTSRPKAEVICRMCKPAEAHLSDQIGALVEAINKLSDRLDKAKL